MQGSQTKNATYTFEELICKIAWAGDNTEIDQIEWLIREEMTEYALFYLHVLNMAIRIRRKELRR